MNIAPITQTTAPQQPAAASSGSILSSDFETFLTMLTTQARYQDPLEPIDSSEYSAQLAQFSMVEQQVKSNDLLTALSAQLGAGTMAQLAGWIGMEIRTSEPVQFDGAPITVATKPVLDADQLTLVVYDTAGVEVQRQQLPVTGGAVDWSGVSADGTPFPAGLYRFEVESHAAGELINTLPAEAYGKVAEARTENGASLLVLEGGSEIATGSVTALRAAPG